MPAIAQRVTPSPQLQKLLTNLQNIGQAENSPAYIAANAIENNEAVAKAAEEFCVAYSKMVETIVDSTKRSSSFLDEALDTAGRQAGLTFSRLTTAVRNSLSEDSDNARRYSAVATVIKGQMEELALEKTDEYTAKKVREKLGHAHQR